MKQRLSLFAILVAALLLALVFGSCHKPSRTPYELFSDAIDATLSAHGIDTDAEAKAPTNATVSLLYKPTADTEGLLPIGETKMESFFHKDGLKGASFSTSIGGEALTLSGYAQDSKLAVSSSLWGDTAYGLDLTTAKENYLDSIFAEVGGNFDTTDLLGVNGEFFDQLTANTPDLSAYETVLRDYFELLEKAVEDNTEATVTETAQGQQLTFVLDTADLKTILQGVYDYAKKDTVLRDTANSILKDLEIEGMEDAMAEYDDFFASPEALNELFTTLDNNPFTLTLTVDLNDDEQITKAALLFEATIDGEAGSVGLTLDLSQAGKTVISVRSGAANGEDSFSASITHEVLADDANTYREALSVSYNEGGITASLEVYTLSYNKADGSFTISSHLLGAVSQPLSLKGTYQATEDNMTLALTSVVLPGEMLGSPESVTMAIDLTLSVKTGDSVNVPASLPAYTDLFSLTEKQMEEIMLEMMNDPVVGMIEDLFNAAAPEEDWENEGSWDEDWDEEDWDSEF